MIKQFKIAYPEENVDLKDEFPNHFVVTFNEFGHDFDVKYEKKHSARDLSEGTGDIFVIDSNSGQPVKYNLDNVEVDNSFICNIHLIISDLYDYFIKAI